MVSQEHISNLPGLSATNGAAAAVPDMLQAALEHARAGIPVFPCQPNGKAPICDRGFRAATTDEAQIKRWWAQHPNANIGIRPADAGLIVIDVDRYKGDVDQALIGRLPATYTVQSPSGGEHYYFESALQIGNTV